MEHQTTERAPASNTILLVDDEPNIRSFISALLIGANYNVLMAENAEAALQQSRDYKGAINLLLSNIQMPGMTGIELGTRITLERPETNVMLMSGFSGGLLVLNEGWHFLSKPFVPSQLLGIVTTILNHPPIPNFNEHKA